MRETNCYVILNYELENKGYVALGVCSLILVITTREHSYTHNALHKRSGLDLDVISYEKILKRDRSPYPATHIFTDFDRLPLRQVQDAAALYRALKSAGVKVLNDPAGVCGRYELLRALHSKGLNSFNAYRADSLETPSRWPVFLRLDGTHAAPISGLLHNPAELEEAIERALEVGTPPNALLIVEYAGEPVRPGLFRKLSVFKVGEKLLGHTCVHEENWIVKYGQPGIAPAELYDEEYDLVANNPFTAAVEPAFQLAGIDYGRVDFGLVDGRPQIFEINTNPHVELDPKASPVERRNQSNALFKANYLEAMAAIDTERRPAWVVKSSVPVRSARIVPARVRKLLATSYRKLRKSDSHRFGSLFRAFCRILLSVTNRAATTSLRRTARDWRAYLHLVVRRKPRNVRVLIFGQGRTGSTLLEDLLCSTGYFARHGEILGEGASRVRYPAAFVKGSARRRQSNHFVCHVKPDHLTIYRERASARPVELKAFFESIVADGFKIIYLRRSNRLAQFLSERVAQARGRYHKRDDRPETQRVMVDRQQLMRFAAWRKQRDAEEAAALEGFAFIDVEYGRDLEDPSLHQSTIDRIMDALSIEKRPVRTLSLIHI